MVSLFLTRTIGELSNLTLMTPLIYARPNRLKAMDGEHAGPSLLEDQIAREKIHRFDHERIPERVVHARGTGAHGYFRVFDDRAAKWTKAGVLTDPSRTTPIFIRFSTVQGSRGSAVSAYMREILRREVKHPPGYCSRRSRVCHQVLH